MGGKTTVIEGNRISNFQLNNATYGLTVPLVLGTSRIAGNIIDWVDFTTITHTETQRSGKGGGSKTVQKSYTYTVAAIVGLCEGPVSGIGQIWLDKEVMNASKLGIDAFIGLYGQAPWNYMTSKHSERSLAYSGLCYVAGVWDLGSSGGLPNLNFEIKGMLLPGDGIDVNPAEAVKYIITDRFNGVGFGLGSLDIKTWQQFKDYTEAVDLLISAPLTEQKKAFEIIRDICECANVSFFWSQNRLKFVVRADEPTDSYVPSQTPWYELTADDFLPFSDGALVKFSRKNSADAYNAASIEFINRANDYQKEQASYMVTADIAKRGMRQMPKKSLPYLHTKERAEYVARILTQESLFVRNKYTFILGWTHCLLEPGDFVTLTEPDIGLDAEPVIIEEITENVDGEIECIAYSRVAGAYNPPVYATHHADRPTIDYGIAPGEINPPFIFCPPPDELTGLIACIAASGQPASWGGAGVWLSLDTVSYKRVGEIEGPSVYGYLTEALTATATVVKVKLYGGQLLTSSEDVRLFLDGEVMSYRTAQLTGEREYLLTDVRRGLDFTVAKVHDAMTRLAVLEGLFEYQFTGEDIGKEVYVKLTSYNIFGVTEQSLEDVDAVSTTLIAYLPPEAGSIELDEDTYILRDGTVLSNIIVNFSAPAYPLLDRYDIYCELNGSGVFQLVGQTTADSYIVKALPQAKTVRVKAVTVNQFGISAKGVISGVYAITGKSSPPPDVTGLRLVQDEYNRANIIITWNAVTDIPDLRGYEVRLGSDWDEAQKISPVIFDNSFGYAVSGNGTYSFLAKAIDNSGNYSAHAASGQIAALVTPDAPENLTAEQEVRDRSLIRISWTAPSGKDIASYEIYAENTVIATVKETAYTWYAPYSGTYNIAVRAVTVAGFYSNMSNASITCTLEPYDVTGFAISQSLSDRSLVTMAWDKPLSLDVAYFEIRKGVSWDSGDVIGQRVTGTVYQVQIRTEELHSYFIKAVSVAGKYSLNAAKAEGIFNLRPSPVTNIYLKQLTNDKSQLLIEFDGINESDLVCYEIRLGYTWADSEKIAETKETRWQHQLSTTGSVKILIKSKNAAGFYSAEASASIYTVLEPASVTGFMSLQNGEYIELYWDKHSESDVTGYEIREGLSFAQGALVASGVTVTDYKLKVDTERHYLYHIKAVNRALKYSLNVASSAVYVADLPPKNVIETFDELILQNGVKDKVELGQSLINFSNVGGRWMDYPTTKFSDIGGTSVLKLAKTGPEYAASGSYLCAKKDLGQTITANISCDFRSTVLFRGHGTAILQIRLSRDNVIWTEWQDFKPAIYTFRYLEARVTLTTADYMKTPEVNVFRFEIDVPDSEQSGSVTIPVGGKKIFYNKPFYTVPIVTPTAVGDNRFVQILSKTNADFTAKVVDRQGNDVGGQIDYRSRGY